MRVPTTSVFHASNGQRFSLHCTLATLLFVMDNGEYFAFRLKNLSFDQESNLAGTIVLCYHTWSYYEDLLILSFFHRCPSFEISCLLGGCSINDLSPDFRRKSFYHDLELSSSHRLTGRSNKSLESGILSRFDL